LHVDLMEVYGSRGMMMIYGGEEEEKKLSLLF
jgi:hypothetical protein